MRRKLPAVLALVVSLALPGAAAAEESAATTDSGDKKERLYRFEALDIEGNIDKPRLMYFLNRVQGELEAGRARKRSFLPELHRSEAAPEL